MICPKCGQDFSFKVWEIHKDRCKPEKKEEKKDDKKELVEAAHEATGKYKSQLKRMSVEKLEALAYGSPDN